MAYRFLAVVGEAAEGDVVAVPSRVGIEGVEVGQVDGENTNCDTVHQESSAGLPAPAGDELTLGSMSQFTEMDFPKVITWSLEAAGARVTSNRTRENGTMRFMRLVGHGFGSKARGSKETTAKLRSAGQTSRLPLRGQEYPRHEPALPHELTRQDAGMRRSISAGSCNVFWGRITVIGVTNPLQ
jgi:hypothetical protein